MSNKDLDSHRWDQPIIQAGDHVLTKRDVFNYYSDPKIRAKLLPQLQGNPILAIQSLTPDKQVYKRNIAANIPIQIGKATRDSNDKNSLAWFAERRFSEFHPVVRSKTNKIWVDIDPGGKQSPEDLKPIVKQVHEMFSKLPELTDTAIAYSGGRGYYVTGTLKKPQNTEAMRKQLNTQLRVLTRKNPELTLHPPNSNQIRLDTSTLHDMGSIRALYSLNSITGLASVPILPEKLDSFDPKIDANPKNLAIKTFTPKRLGREFAPGIPAARITHPIPNITDKHWTAAIQEHSAQRAGKHWDLRLVDPTTTYAHSWALPKSRLPLIGGKPVLAVQTPTHTARYALTFGEGKPKEIKKGYGKGLVDLKIKEPVRILSSTPNTVKFERDSEKDKLERYLLFRTKDNAWLLRNITQKKEATTRDNAYTLGYQSILEKLGVNVSKMSTLPLENTDPEMPASALAKLIGDLPPAPKRLEQRRRQGSPYQTRMNQPTSWNSPMEISPYMAVGPSPIMGYW